MNWNCLQSTVWQDFDSPALRKRNWWSLICNFQTLSIFFSKIWSSLNFLAKFYHFAVGSVLKEVFRLASYDRRWEAMFWKLVGSQLSILTQRYLCFFNPIWNGLWNLRCETGGGKFAPNDFWLWKLPKLPPNVNKMASKWIFSSLALHRLGSLIWNR